MKRKTLFPLVLAFLLTLSACSSSNTAQTEGSSSQTVQTGTEESVSSVNPSDMFTDNDLEIEYDEEASAKITLSGDSASSDSDAVQISDRTVGSMLRLMTITSTQLFSPNPT